MIKRALPAVLALLSLCLPLQARAADRFGAFDNDTVTIDDLRKTAALDPSHALSLHRPDLYSSVSGSVLIHSLPVLALLDGRRFPLSSELGRMGMAPLDLVPVAFLNSVDVSKVGASPVYGSDGPGGTINMRLNRIYAGGEVGVFYGRSGGKYGRDEFETYITGGIGNEHFQITAGASYRESNAR
jgi:hypothetical protein